MTLATFDIIILIIMAAGLIVGAKKGIIKQLASIIGLIAGIIAAKIMYETVAEWLCPTVTDSMTIAQILSFVLIWIAVPLLFSLAASVITKALELIYLGWLNRILGAALGAMKYALLLSILFCTIDFLDNKNELISQETKQSSILYTPTKGIATWLFPIAKRTAEKYIHPKQGVQQTGIEEGENQV